MFENENDENQPRNYSQISTPSTIKKAPRNNFSTMAFCDEDISDEVQHTQKQRISNESFEAIERMCDKTASDPNSTLFQYIHGENKEEIIAVKKRSADDSDFKTPSKKDLEEIDEEAQSLQRLLHELCVHEEKQLEQDTPIKVVDVTQLEDIEAPSKLWETTIFGDTTLQTSPVKMVGLLRPSTIIEECSEETCDISSQISFQSALKSSEASTSCYDTAHDSTGPSATAPIYVDHKDTCLDELKIESQSKGMSEVSTDLDISEDLINLDKTIAASATESAISTKCENGGKSTEVINDQKESSSDDSESIIEILSDDEGDNIKADTKNEIHIESIKSEIVVNTSYNEVLECTLSCVDNDDKENSVKLNESGEHSLHFNDTIEEVEYMMKKGMQYMNDNAACTMQPLVIESPTIVRQLKTKENTFTFSPKKNERYHSPVASPRSEKHKPMAVVTGVKVKPTIASPKRTPQISSASKVKSVTKRYGMDIKPIPKMDLFKKPTATATSSRLKEPTHKQFSHIVSPIGTYMKKTATTPLMSNFKKRFTRPDMHNASIFRELEQESRIYKPKFENVSNSTNSKIPGLPKKAYISSEFKHITDERTPVTIPGGKKIQKYIEGAMLPTVVRHEGKVKLPATISNNPKDATKQRNNASLANLSVMSGDISVYTMTDAQKF